MRDAPRIAVIYTHFPHYRAAVFAALSQYRNCRFQFFYDARGVAATIASGQTAGNHRPLPVRMWRGLMWQGGALRLALVGDFDAFVFLGNPFILSTWPAALVARMRGRPVAFWTHGWLRRERGVKASLRRAFYRLADMLLLYGYRARDIGIAEGFAPDRLRVIGNSLDYPAQKAARERALQAGPDHPDNPGKPYFLTVARLVPEVRLDLAIAAMARLPAGTALVVAGSGPEREALAALAGQLGVDVRFLGAIYDEDRLARLFVGARAVVSPGKVGLLAIHALAYGAPVITHGNLDQQMPEVEVIEDGLTGALFRQDDVDSLTRSMAIFLDGGSDDKALVPRRRSAAIARIEAGCTPERQVESIVAALGDRVKKVAR